MHMKIYRIPFGYHMNVDITSNPQPKHFLKVGPQGPPFPHTHREAINKISH